MRVWIWAPASDTLRGSQASGRPDGLGSGIDQSADALSRWRASALSRRQWPNPFEEGTCSMARDRADSTPSSVPPLVFMCLSRSRGRYHLQNLVPVACSSPFDFDLGGIRAGNRPWRSSKPRRVGCTMRFARQVRGHELVPGLEPFRRRAFTRITTFGIQAYLSHRVRLDRDYCWVVRSSPRRSSRRALRPRRAGSHDTRQVSRKAFAKRSGDTSADSRRSGGVPLTR